jgi:hypothetical protein
LSDSYSAAPRAFIKFIIDGNALSRLLGKYHKDYGECILYFIM